MAPITKAARSLMSEREFVFMMATLQALQALAIDSMLPALGQIAHDLNVSDPNRRQLVVAIFLIGTGLGALIPGTLADRYGRRPVLFVCLGFYILPSLACALVQDFNTLLILRAVQAIGCSGLAVIPSTIIRDRFDGDRMARLQSLIFVIFLAVPMLAPSLGQAVMLLFSWRAIFVCMALLAGMVAVWVWLRLPETLDKDNCQPLQFRAIVSGMRSVATNRASIGYVLASTLTTASVWSFINSSQQLIGEAFGAGNAYPVLFGAMATGLALANFINSRIVERFGARRVSHAGVIAFIFLASLQVWLAHYPHQTLWQFAPVTFLNLALTGFLGANFTSIALQPFARNAGVAASVQIFIRMVLASLIGAMVGQAYDGTARPLSYMMLAAGTLSLLLVLFSERGRLFRRLNYPGKMRTGL